MNNYMVRPYRDVFVITKIATRRTSKAQQKGMGWESLGLCKQKGIAWESDKERDQTLNQDKTQIQILVLHYSAHSNHYLPLIGVLFHSHTIMVCFTAVKIYGPNCPTSLVRIYLAYITTSLPDYNQHNIPL